MDEAKQMMDQGTGTPFVTLFDGNSQPIMDKKNNLPLGMFVTGFTYEYDEEDGDKADIDIETDNINLLDQPEFGEKMPLLLQWGHVLPTGEIKASPVRKVIIRDTEWEGREAGVRITIKCSDILALLKNQPASRADDSFEKWLETLMVSIPQAQLVDHRLRDRLTVGSTNYDTEIKTK
jgi:hypothetical protein